MGSASLYPNPATDIITISTPDNSSDKKVEIYSISGQIVAKMVTSGDVNEINVSVLPVGQYIITTQDSEGNKTVNKIIKK